MRTTSLLAIVLALVLSPLATARTTQYWVDILGNDFALSSTLPKFALAGCG